MASEQGSKRRGRKDLFLISAIKTSPEANPRMRKDFKVTGPRAGYKEIINRKRKSNLPQFLVPNIVPGGIGQLYSQTCGSGRLTRAHRLEKIQRIK